MHTRSMMLAMHNRQLQRLQPRDRRRSMGRASLPLDSPSGAYGVHLPHTRRTRHGKGALRKPPCARRQPRAPACTPTACMHTHCLPLGHATDGDARVARACSRSQWTQVCGKCASRGRGGASVVVVEGGSAAHPFALPARHRPAVRETKGPDKRYAGAIHRGVRWRGRPGRRLEDLHQAARRSGPLHWYARGVPPVHIARRRRLQVAL